MAWRRLIVYDADTMTPERWQRVRRILDRALELRGDERSAFLLEACGDDAILRSDIETLLRADACGGLPLDAPVEKYADALVGEIADGAPASDTAIGRRVGPYRLVREIGRGGMGVVYLAERDDGQFEQRVAIKLLPPGLDTAERERRLRSERQILASLEHPNIARLLDGGVTADGLPFLAIEYIEGMPIHRYCDKRRLGIKQRLALMLGVCDAVQYAHRKLIVHRDLKPANILVTADGQVTLLDFGIAKLLDPEADAPDTPLTRTGMRPLTPEYASPEQVRGEPITTGSDVYQLGVLLFELLTGQRPYRFDTRSPAEAERVICTQVPPRPSGVVRRSSPERGKAGRLRATTPERLERSLRGDLDAIVLMALRKEPERRYASAAALAEDVRRHLAALPVTARPDSLSYRARKFVHRHAVGVAASLGVLLLVGGTVSIYTYRLAQERDRAEQAAEDARLEERKTRQVAEFVTGLFNVANPDRSEAADLTARDLLDRGADRIESGLTGQPLVRASMLDVIGLAYSGLGLYDRARPLLDTALALRRQHLGDESAEVAESLGHLGTVLHRQGDLEGARRHHRQALAIQQDTAGADSRQLVEVLTNLGWVEEEDANYQSARRHLERAVAIHDRLDGPEDASFARTLYMLASVHRRLDDYQHAVRLYVRALSVLEQELGPDHINVARIVDGLAMTKHALGEYDEARQLYERSLRITKAQLGPDHPEVATAAANFSVFLKRVGEFRRAMELYEQALRIEEAALGPENPYISYTLLGLGRLYLQLGQYDRAKPYIERAATLRRAGYGARSSRYAGPLLTLGKIALRTGNPKEARRLLEQALEIQREAQPDATVNQAPAMVALAELAVYTGDPARCEHLVRQALAAVGDTFSGFEGPGVAEARSVLGACLTALGRYQEAETSLVAALEIQQSVDDQFKRDTLKHLATLYDEWGRPAEATRYRQLLQRMPSPQEML